LPPNVTAEKNLVRANSHAFILTMLKLHSNQIHLWFTFYNEIQNECRLNQYRDLLIGEEQDRHQHFHFAKDRHCYLVTRALVRTVLSRYTSITPEQWQFSKNTYGKPSIVNDDHIAKKISFNVSHTQGLIVLAVTRDNALGIDTENIGTRQAPLDVADRFLSPEELADLKALSPESQHERFFQYWTIKEAYIKARGMGLSIPLDQFAFRFVQDKQIELSIRSELKDQPSRWNFWQFRLSTDYFTAVCAERSGDAIQQLILKKIVPLEYEMMLNFDLLGQSI
jgi:4'-phosphopantetheinyl transferase